MSDTNDDRHVDGLLDQARALPRSVEPQRDLWPGIRVRIGADMQAARRWPQRHFALAALVLIGVGAGIGFWLGRASAPPFELASVSDEAPLFGRDYTLGTEFVEARSELGRSLARELERMTPETREVVAANLAALEKAHAQINQALSAHPNSVMLQQLLLSAYTEELVFLREVNGLSRSVRVRTEI